MKKICVLCAIGTNGAPYAEYMRKTALALSTADVEFSWKCMLAFDRNKIDVKPEGFECVGKCRNKEDHASINHTATINELVKYADGDYTILADVDIALLKKGWDEDMLRYLDQYDCFGLAYGKWDHKYRDFPTLMFFALKTSLLKELNIDFSPQVRRSGDLKRYYSKEKNQHITGVRLKGKVKKDSGWKIPFEFKSRGLTGMPVKKILMGSKKAKLPFKSLDHKSFCMQDPTHQSEFLLDGDLYATHLQACRGKPFNKKRSQSWQWRANKYILDTYGITI